MQLKHNPSISDQVYDVLLSRIEKGEYRPGIQLPSESDLAAEFGISWTSVRTALSKLETSGHILRLCQRNHYSRFTGPDHTATFTPRIRHAITSF